MMSKIRQSQKDKSSKFTLCQKELKLIWAESMTMNLIGRKRRVFHLVHIELQSGIGKRLLHMDGGTGCTL